jgi:hypothetical protein
MRDGRIKIEKKAANDENLVNGREEEGKNYVKFFVGIKSVFKSSLTLRKPKKELSV